MHNMKRDLLRGKETYFRGIDQVQLLQKVVRGNETYLRGIICVYRGIICV
jgi:hypothetical protein